jgi:hypothetical protein
MDELKYQDVGIKYSGHLSYYYISKEIGTEIGAREQLTLILENIALWNLFAWQLFAFKIGA